MEKQKKSKEELINLRKKGSAEMLKLKDQKVFERELEERIAMAKKITNVLIRGKKIKDAEYEYVLKMEKCQEAKTFLEKFPLMVG
jgi:hypothetical protein